MQFLHVMARCCLARTITVVSLTVSLSAVGLLTSSCHFLHPLLQPLRKVSYSVYPAHWFHLYSVNMSSYYDSKEKSHHSKALTSPYPGSSVERSKVPSDKVDWLVEWKDYSPVEYTAASILAGPKWADPQISDKHFSLKFNEKDGQVERRSLSGLYKVENGRPRNPVGRTGLVGRGLLGRWGPNHAADPIITRWKRDKSSSKIAHTVSGKNILQFVAIKRKDCGEWAIPGVYKGYVDDPRNTDNAWLETEAVNYHDESGETMDNLPLEAGDDAGKVKWVDISEKLKLYANHSHFIKLVAEKRGAHWIEEPVTDCQK
ncbi:PREDICTED: ADP-ribose pyrophosphatase, mitochondrial isoform X4 [Crocodylus porosus]|uniref:ADP-ribose pyrophosphatase, mitochondrial isoform X4 n=1 Tax=Crocodylus porosus TaxID=8502 RepID=UPI00093F60BA|nr:PREDICTED: ADP-ribose pyrophosphatase, mitochondrial isoform X4 [Crocodylus porosus]